MGAGNSNAYLPATGLATNDSTNIASSVSTSTAANPPAAAAATPVNFEKVLKNLILDREPKDMKPL
jgi:hypothetical protein